MKELFKSREFLIFFLAVTVVKLALMGTFSSDYVLKLFVPFVENSFSSEENPYELFLQTHTFNAFPYPPLMLWLCKLSLLPYHVYLLFAMGGGKAYFEDPLTLNTLSFFLLNFSFKLPSLIADICCLLILCRLCPGKEKYLLYFYYASPIVIYAVYMHGQLDMLPTAFLIAAVYFFYKTKLKSHYILSALFLGAALLTKLHILAAVPLFILLIANSSRKFYVSAVFLITLTLMTLCLLPYSSSIFWDSVLFNKEQSLLTKVYVEFVSLKLYLPIFALMFIYLMMLKLKRINRQLSLSLLGVLFSVFLCLIPPMPGWYVWIVPFIAVFFSNVSNRYKQLVIFALFNILYLLFFVGHKSSELIDLYCLGHSLESLKIASPLYSNILFTLLAGCLIYITIEFYYYDLINNSHFKQMGRAFAIGIAGDSGSGKTTLLKLLSKTFGVNRILFIEGDGDHKWERNAQEWKQVTHLNPKANWLYRQAQDIQTLKDGQSIERHDYDHDTGKFTEKKHLRPKPYLVLSSLHAFYLPQMRELFDLRIFMAPDEALRLFWKVSRDIKNRGYSQDTIKAQIDARKEDSEKYICPQKQYADLIITYFDPDLRDPFDISYKPKLSLKFTCSLAVNLEPLIENLQQEQISCNYEYDTEMDQQHLIIHGVEIEGCSNINLNSIYKGLQAELGDLPAFNYFSTDNISNADRILQCMLLILISHKLAWEAD